MAIGNTVTLLERLSLTRARAYGRDVSHRSSVPFLHLRLENKDKKKERSREQGGNGGTPGATRSREASLFGCANVSRETATAAPPVASSRGRAARPPTIGRPMQTPTVARLHSPRRRPKEGGDYRLTFLSCTPWRVVRRPRWRTRRSAFRLKDRLEASARLSRSSRVLPRGVSAAGNAHRWASPVTD
jgi:hypothetical protein